MSSGLKSVLVVGSGSAGGARELEFRQVVLVERADVLIIGLLRLCLGLGDGKVVGNAGTEALLRLSQSFVRQIDVRAGGLD